MKKIIAILLAVTMLLSLAACGTETPQNSDTQPGTSSTDAPVTDPSTGTTEPSTDATTPPETTDKPVGYSYSVDLTGVTTLEELETRIEEHLAASITSLNLQWEALAAEIDTYEKYVKNVERVSEFYETIIAETDQMCIMLYEYSAAYARMILDSDMSTDDKYDAIEGINSCTRMPATKSMMRFTKAFSMT